MRVKSWVILGVIVLLVGGNYYRYRVMKPNDLRPETRRTGCRSMRCRQG